MRVEVCSKLRLGGDCGAALRQQRNELRCGARRVTLVVAYDCEGGVDEREQRLRVEQRDAAGTEHHRAVAQFIERFVERQNEQNM